MSSFKLKKHKVVRASFTENSLVEKKSLEFGVDGVILFPKEWEDASQIVVKLQLHLGREEERLSLFLETVSIFDMEDCAKAELTESFLRQECLPVALVQLKETVKDVSEAYGLPSIDLISFDEDFNI